MKPYKLVCFDVDGTLLENVKFSWQLFHDHFHIDTKLRDRGRAAFVKGDISYLQWAEHDVELWKEKKVSKGDFFDAIDKHRIMLVKGARETLIELKNHGMKLAVISGSLNVMLERFLPDYDELFDDVFLSRLTFNGKGIINGVIATPYDIEHKATALRMISEREKIPLKQTVFVGDYLNDLHVLQLAGLGIAFNAKHQEVKDAADVVVDSGDMRDILPHILKKQ
jgi:phosphoserine phosphatase